MITITKEFTKEQLQQIIETDHVQCGEASSLARTALASLEAEAVGEVVLGEYDDCGCHPDARVACIAADGQADWENFKDGTRLYTAPPAPVAVPAAMEMDDDFDSAFEHGKAVGWNACRAAMLQGKAEPVRQPDELPMDYLQGHKDGLEWAARLAEANHPQTGDWLYDDPLELAKAIRKGPDMPTAPVQGWIPCSERMPEEVGRYWCYVEEQNSLGKSHYQWNCSWNGDRWWVESENGGRVTHWMPLQAAPQQEVKSGR